MTKIHFNLKSSILLSNKMLGEFLLKSGTKKKSSLLPNTIFKVLAIEIRQEKELMYKY